MGNRVTKLCSCIFKKSIPKNITRKEVPKYIPEITRGRVIDVYDGDTFTILGRVKNNPKLFQFQIRLDGIDCPEKRTKNVIEKEVSIIAKKTVEHRVLNKIVYFENVKLDKYGRLLTYVFYDKKKRSLNQELLDLRLAVKYDGGTKFVPTNWKKYMETGQLQ